MSVLEPTTGFIGNNLGDDSYDLQVKEGIFSTNCEEVLVLHKKQVKMMRPQDIGDAMEIIKLKAKSKKLKDELNKESVISGMSIYQWFDEHAGSTEYYAYGLDRTKIDWVNDVCKTVGLGVSLEDAKFVKILGGAVQETIEEALSFIFGLALLYGKFTIKDGMLQHAVIQLPLVGSIAMQEESLLTMKEELFERGIYLVVDYITQKSGQLLQINIDDEEVLSLWAGWMGGEAQNQSALIELVNDAVGDEIDLDNYVLKFLHK